MIELTLAIALTMMSSAAITGAVSTVENIAELNIEIEEITPAGEPKVNVEVEPSKTVDEPTETKEEPVIVEATFFDDADAFFKKYVKSGLVDYKSINTDKQVLNTLVKKVSEYSPTSADKKAFYINAYNIMVIKGLIDNYPVGNPLDISGFFDTKTFKVAGQSITLNHIENNILRPTYKDDRLHFVLVCGAKGCPPITNFAYTPDNVNYHLKQQTTKALNNSNFIKVDDGGKKVLISEIFKWYAEDFPEDLIGYLNGYRSNKIPADYTVDYYTYDWTINAQ